MIFLRTNYVILVIFYGFLLWGFFDNEDDLFLYTYEYHLCRQ